MEFNFNQTRIHWINKELSRLDGNNPAHYDKYVKLKRQQINLVDNNELYYNKILSQFKFYLLHLAKLYFYWGYGKSEGLNNPDWTKQHWAEEISQLFRFTDRLDFYNSDKELNLKINKLDAGYRLKLFRELTLINKLELRNNNDIIDKLTKGDKDDVHELPPLDSRELSLKWDKFIEFYRTFTAKIFDRISYSMDYLREDSMLEFIEIAVSNKYNNERELRNGTKDIKFSELAVEDIIEMFRNY